MYNESTFAIDWEFQHLLAVHISSLTSFPSCLDAYAENWPISISIAQYAKSFQLTEWNIIPLLDFLYMRIGWCVKFKPFLLINMKHTIPHSEVGYGINLKFFFKVSTARNTIFKRAFVKNNLSAQKQHWIHSRMECLMRTRFVIENLKLLKTSIKMNENYF